MNIETSFDFLRGHNFPSFILTFWMLLLADVFKSFVAGIIVIFNSLFFNNKTNNPNVLKTKGNKILEQEGISLCVSSFNDIDLLKNNIMSLNKQNIKKNKLLLSMMVLQILLINYVRNF